MKERVQDEKSHTLELSLYHIDQRKQKVGFISVGSTFHFIFVCVTENPYVMFRSTA
jgi:hypothetical protein